MIGLLVSLIVGLGLLVGGAELLVRGASRLAAAAGLSPLVIGLTVVAYGTSTPELAVSLDAAWRGATDLSLGNVVGSNVFNVLFILGLSALVTPLVVASRMVRREVPILIATSFALLVLAADGTVSRLDGALLMAGLVVYTIGAIVESRREAAAVRTEFSAAYGDTPGCLLAHAGLVAGGLVLLIIGTEWAVDAAVAMARHVGVSDLVIGLTVVAAGTSLPEVATSLLAAVRGQRDIAVGNVVGSNIYNVLAILGATALVTPVPVSTAALWFDVPVMVGVALACLPIFLSGARITRGEGFCLLAAYVAYTGYLVLDAADHERLPLYRTALTVVLVPLAIVLVLDLLRRGWRTTSGGHQESTA